MSSDEKVALFRHLFRGRTDVYPIRWASKTSGNSGYAPACVNEWRAGLCEELGVPAALEISRSGQAAHAWVFVASRVAARDARRLGTAIISRTCAGTRQLKLNSYDLLFPNQDTMPKWGFGNLIALRLQKGAREIGCSVFVDAELTPYDSARGVTAVYPATLK